MANQDRTAGDLETRRAWNQNAAFWDERMAEGNHFVEVLIWPATKRLLNLQPGERILDIACGNGLYARRLAAMGVEVVAFDFSEELIARACARTGDKQAITYHVLDASNETALKDLGRARFEAALCQMALFDMAEIRPLFHVLGQLLRPGGRFVFSILHPCFNCAQMIQVAEREDLAGELVTRYSVQVSGYLTPNVSRAAAMTGQPTPHLLFHRPLHELLGVAFDAGFVLDGLEETSFPSDYPRGSDLLSWGGNYSEIPPVLVARLRLPG
jgi:2-polyprenyl-3-methyl-5-hydroxy-6-metoxy-1,4-benzoquinol methylase